MKSTVFLVVVSIALFPALSASASPRQDLDRINDLVNQARGLADNARSDGLQAASGIGVGAVDQPQHDNPFAREARPGTIGQWSNRPQVGVDADAIRINAGGRQFTIPRVAGNDGPDQLDPKMAAPTRHAYANGLAGGQTAKINAAMKTANDYRVFGDAARLFRNAEFPASLAKIDTIEDAKASPPIEQFHSLCLFANGDYLKSAELAYSAVTKTPFYSWEQLRNYYGNPELYAQQYRQLQAQVADHESDPSLRFLLGYHHLMLGHRQHAAREFEFVLTKLPNDPIIKDLLLVSQKMPPSPVN